VRNRIASSTITPRAILVGFPPKKVPPAILVKAAPQIGRQYESDD
jgi:hypothetical protein